MISAVYRYSAFGLTCRSIFPIPELCVAEPDDQADVNIRYGSVPAKIEDVRADGVFYQVSESQFLLNMPKVARYLVQCGNEIVVDVYAESDAQSVRAFLLSTVMSALLLQRGLLVLHGSAFATSSGAVLLLGGASAGKSATGASMWIRGYPLLADELCAVRFGDGGRPELLPAFPAFYLWGHTAQALDLAERGVERVRPALDKWRFSTEETFRSGPLPIHLLLVLQTTNAPEASLRPIAGNEKFTCLQSTVYRPTFVCGMHLEQNAQLQLLRFARLPAKLLLRPKHGDTFAQTADMLVQALT